jgi:hypothetical protein
MKGRWVSSLSVDPTNTKRLVVTYAGYGNWENVDTNKVVIMTEDATVAVPTFTPLGATLPNLPVYTSRFVVNPDNNQSVLFVGTEKGLYVSSDLATFQQELESEIGNVPVVDISVRKYSANMTSLLRKEFTLKKDNTVFVTAYGKGVYTTSNLAYQRNGNDEDETPTVATTYAQLYPNPATNNVTVKVSLKETANVTISLKGIDGRELATIPSVEMNAGNTDVQLLTQRLASGVYFIEVTAKGGTTDYSQLLKLMIAK